MYTEYISLCRYSSVILCLGFCACLNVQSDLSPLPLPLVFRPKLDDWEYPYYRSGTDEEVTENDRILDDLHEWDQSLLELAKENIKHKQKESEEEISAGKRVRLSAMNTLRKS